MSQLVRRAIENEIRGRSMPDVGPDSRDGQLSDVTDAVETLRGTVDRIATRLEIIEEAVQDDVRELATRVFPALPTADEIEAAGTSSYDTGESADRCGTLTQIADSVGEQEEHVRQALQQLQQDTAQVQTKVLDDQTRYYKEG